MQKPPPRGRPPLEADPQWIEWLTDASENITLPQTSFAGGNKEPGDEENYELRSNRPYKNDAVKTLRSMKINYQIAQGENTCKTTKQSSTMT